MDNIQSIIQEKSLSLFLRKGYDAVSMREIAAACGIAVGNLTYYYRKEELLLLVHDRIYAPAVEAAGSLQSSFFASEYAFLRYILENPALYRLYKQVINIPALRESYYAKHHRGYEELSGDAGLYPATVAFCSLSYAMMESDLLQADFDGVFRSICEAWYAWRGEDADDEEIQCGMQSGMEILKVLQEQLNFNKPL